jgi:hypothetical protein
VQTPHSDVSVTASRKIIRTMRKDALLPLSRENARLFCRCRNPYNCGAEQKSRPSERSLRTMAGPGKMRLCHSTSSPTPTGRSDRRGSGRRPRSRQRSSPQESARAPAKSVCHLHRSPEQPANPTYWLSTNAELKGPTITLHVEGCPILRRSRWRALRVLTGPLTRAQIAVLPDHGYQACGRCNPAAPA